MRQIPLISGLFLAVMFSAQAQNSRPEFTPAIIQVSNGPGYDNFAEDGAMYCVPSSYTMDLFWLSHMGFTTLAPAYDYDDPGSAANLAITDNLDRVIAGLMQTGKGPRGGTTGANEAAGFSLYLNLKGLSGNYSNEGHLQPTLSDFETAFSGTYNIAVVNIGWFTQSSLSPTTYIQGGGHDVALVDYVGDAISGTATINNPEPRSLYSNVQNQISDAQQTPGVAEVSGVTLLNSNNQPLTGSYLQFITPEFQGNGPRLAVLMGLGNWSFSASPGFTPATFTLIRSETVDTNGGSFSAEAPIDDAGSGHGITKTGLGTLTLTGNVSTAGNWAVAGGVLESTLSTDGVSQATPFGTGNMTLSGSTSLVLSPSLSSATAGNRDVSLLLNSGPGSALSVEGGGASLELNRGANDSLTVTIGGHTSGSDPNLILTGSSTLVIKSQDGIAGLGGTTRLFLEGTASNHPLLDNTIVTPALLGELNDSASSAAFLTYTEAGGFAQAASTAGSSFAGTNDSTIFVTSAAINLGSGQATVAALNASHNISGDTGSSLEIVPLGAADAGLILNGSSITVGDLNFGGRTAYVYSNLDGGVISSTITADSLVTFGPGQTTVSASSAAISGPVFVNSGTLKVENQGLGDASVVVQQNATLKVAGTVSCPLSARGGIILLEEGTISGALDLDSESTLGGQGTISYADDTTLTGNIGSIGEAGLLNFEASSGSPVLDVASNTIFQFTLTSLDGNVAGTDWTYLVFNNSLSAADGFTINLNFLAATDPETSPNAEFWQTDHSWNFIKIVPTSTPLIGTIAVPEGNLFSTGRFHAEYEMQSGDGYIVLNYQAVPEPSTYGSVILAFAFCAFRRLRSPSKS